MGVRTNIARGDTSMSVSELEKEAFHLWMSAGEKTDRERTAMRKEAVLTLEKAIGGHEIARRSSLTSTLRKWKGVVACEEGNLMTARFEFLQGRIVAELNDPENLPWFDAAIVESEVWDGFISDSFRVEKLRELAENLDRSSILFAAVGDRSNAQFTADWAGWFRILINPSIPTSGLAERILDYIKGQAAGGAQKEEILMNQFPLKNNVFNWNYFWFARIAQEIAQSLKNIFKTVASLEALVRGASLLATPSDDLKLLLQSDLSRKQFSIPESQMKLLEQMQIDLQQLQTLEKGANQYMAEVTNQWNLSASKRRDDVVQTIHPERRRR